MEKMIKNYELWYESMNTGRMDENTVHSVIKEWAPVFAQHNPAGWAMLAEAIGTLVSSDSSLEIGAAVTSKLCPYGWALKLNRRLNNN